jgi:amino acid adenylation domain-containing protein
MIPFEHTGLQNIRLLSHGAKEAADFRTLFVLQPAEEAENVGTFLNLEAVPVELEDFHTYPLSISCTMKDSKVALEARFARNILEGEQIQRMLEHFEYVAKQLSEQTETTSLEEVTLFTPHDRQQIYEWNNQNFEVVDQCIHGGFQEQVNTAPNAPAICSFDRNFTYSQLDFASNQLAHFLTGCGIGPHKIVPLFFDKSAWTVVAMLGVMKAGGAYCSINPSQPLSRSLEMIDDVGASTVLVSTQFEGLLGAHVSQLIVVGSALLDKLSRTSDLSTYQPAEVSPNDPAMVVFTSGSTGKPKAIVLEHSSICTMTRAQTQTMRFAPTNRVLQFASYSFDVSNGEIHTTLLTGGCVCIPSEDERLNDLSGAIERMKANWLFLTPTVASLMSSASVPSLKTLVLGGEAAPRALLQKWADKVDLVMSYGPAECSVNCTGNPPASADSDPATIGRPLGASAWICDIADHNRLAPIGCVGELVIEGPIVARGYLGDIKKTKSVFIQDPAWLSKDSRKSYRIYKTGDLVKYNPDGSINFVDRKDTQIKLHGQRIELGEIEHHVKLRLPEFSHLAVESIKRSNEGSKQSLALLACKKAIELEGSPVLPLTKAFQAIMTEVQQSLRQSLPEYMIPSVYIPMGRMPMTSSGKLDRTTMRRLASNLSDEQMLHYSLGKVTKRAPETETECALQHVWAKVLDMSPVVIGADDNFFGIGGDSITAMKLVVQARLSGLSLSVAEIFASPRLANMAATIIENKSTSAITQTPEPKPFSLLGESHNEERVSEIISAAPLVSQGNIIDILPTTDFQSLALTGALMKSRWMLNYFCFSGTGSLATSKLKQACYAAVKNHAILRTVFTLHRNRYLQVVLDQFNPPFEYHQADQDFVSYTEAIRKREKLEEFKPGQPFTKFFIVRRIGSLEYQVIIRLSHAQYDGASLPLIWQNIAAAYNATPEIPSHDFSVYLSDEMARRASSCDHWRQYLAGSSMTRITSEQTPRYNRKSTQGINIARKIPQLPVALQGITASTIIRAAWAYVLAQFTAQSDVVFGHVVAGRNRETGEYGNISGPCMNIQPVRILFSQDWTVLDLLTTLQKQYATNMPFEGLGFRDMIEECTGWPKWTRFTSILQHQNAAKIAPLVLGDTELKMSVSVAQEETADFTLFTQERGDEIEVALSSVSEGITGDMVQNVLDTLCSIVMDWTEDPNMALASPKELQNLTPQLPIQATSSSVNGIVPPNTHLETMKAYEHKRNLLTRAWTTLLGENLDINPESSFWDLGGDFVAVGQLFVLLRREGVDIGVEELIDHPDFADQLFLLCSV